jgi:hypothetical protein
MVKQDVIQSVAQIAAGDSIISKEVAQIMHDNDTTKAIIQIMRGLGESLAIATYMSSGISQSVAEIIVGYGMAHADATEVVNIKDIAKAVAIKGVLDSTCGNAALNSALIPDGQTWEQRRGGENDAAKLANRLLGRTSMPKKTAYSIVHGADGSRSRRTRPRASVLRILMGRQPKFRFN